MPALSILMPVFNELSTVDEAIRQVIDTKYPVEDFELVIVDDGSTDGTRGLLEDGDWGESVRVFFHERNGGKGAAIRTALEHAEGEWSAIMDADLEYDPNDLAQLLRPLLDGEAEVVFGTRGFASHSAFSFWYVMGNKGVTLAANLLFNSWLADVMTCHKVMRTEVFRSLDLKRNGFAIEPEITARLLAAGYGIFEVPVRYNARGRQEGKKLTAADGFRALATLAACRVETRRIAPRRRTNAEPRA